ncbi:MAG: immunoglobulin-like domain-containing protein, partial [Actinomycetota bacterium]
LYAADGIPTVVNFSLGEAHAAESGCASSGMHQAICNLTDAGVTVVAAAGNSAADSTNSFYPAAYPETIAVSAFAALDTTPGSDGCQFFIDTFSYECDDELASFTNWGSVIDVTAPGVRVQSTTFDGGWGLNSGTSMAAPFASGVAALVLAADPTLTPNAVRSIMQTTGECPDGTTAGAATCTGHGEWLVGNLLGTTPDPDGIPEPLIDAAAAVAAATSTEPDTTPPTVTLTSPADGATYEAGVDVVTADYSCTDPESGIASCVGDLPDGATLDTSTPGTGFTFTVTGTDNATNVTTVTHTYDVVDTTAPVITLLGNDPLTHEAGDPFTDPGAEVTDNVDATITISGTSNVDPDTPGDYTITYDNTDAAGNAATQMIRNVTVVDTIAPTVTITNPPDGASYAIDEVVLAAYSCSDAGSGIVSCIGDVATGAGIDTSTPGVGFTFTVTGKDASGNITIVTHAYTVNAAADSTPPTVTLVSPSNGAVYEAGVDVVTADYTCSDAESGIASCVGDVANGATIDTSTPGVGFTFTVTGTDNATNVTTVTHTYDVEDTTVPVITLLGDNPMIHLVGEDFADPGAEVADNVDPTTTISGTSNVDPNTTGDYTITYDYTDAAGNLAATVIRDVTVVNIINDFATSETTVYGTVDGDFTATHEADGSTEVITEVQSGGKPSNRTSRLEHTWTIPFSGGDGIVHLFAGATGESFDVEYSFNGATWYPMLTVIGTPAEQTFPLPVGQPSGDLFIRVVDADRTAGETSLSTVSIDHLFVESQQNGSEPELVLEATTAKVAAVTVVNLSWTEVGTLPYTVWRDGVSIASGVSAWTYEDPLGKKPTGSYTYWVCYSSDVCSNAVTIEF